VRLKPHPEKAKRSGFIRLAVHHVPRCGATLQSVRAPGCYGVQIDGSSFSRTVISRVT
jgi:hypothetical protein